MTKRASKIFALCFVILLASLKFARSYPFWFYQSPSKVYVSLGFHVNLYHSFRGDAPDSTGFGQDIEVIRHVLDVLEKRSQTIEEIPVHWDFDNAYTLEKILPLHAPDIIERIKARVARGLDEIVLMSYNNGMLSSLEPEELHNSLSFAFSNSRNSGISDVFGVRPSIARPQEMMFGPGSVRHYKEQGVDSLMLFYSSIPFDGFRTFVEPLNLEQAHNPLLFKDLQQDEQITILPTYNTGDLVENTSLRAWSLMLRRAQLKKTVKGDVIINLNHDADDIYWKGYQPPFPLSILPNTGGLSQLLKSVEDLEFVEFTTPSRYLKKHSATKALSFSQDTADGSFNGFSSWTDKLSTSQFWTLVDRRRWLKKILFNNKLDHSAFKTETEEFLPLLSTTNFGMATPFLVPQREESVAKDFARFRNDVDFLARFKSSEGKTLAPSNTALRDWVLLTKDSKQKFFSEYPSAEVIDFEKGVYGESFSLAKVKGSIDLPGRAADLRVTDDGIEVFSKKTSRFQIKPPHVVVASKELDLKRSVRDERSAEGLGLLKVKYNFVDYPTKGVEISFKTLPGDSRIYAHIVAEIPNFAEDRLFKPHALESSRPFAAVSEFSLLPVHLSNRAKAEEPFKIIRQNYLGIKSEYFLDYHKLSSNNLKLDSVNNQVSESFVAASSQGVGVLLAKSNVVLSSPAFVNLRQKHMSEKLSLELHPFSALSGAQLETSTLGNGVGRDMALLFGEQYSSSAPSFNGESFEFFVSLELFDGEENLKQAALRAESFAWPGLYFSNLDNLFKAKQQVQLDAPRSIFSVYDQSKGLWTRWNYPVLKATCFSYELVDLESGVSVTALVKQRRSVLVPIQILKERFGENFTKKELAVRVATSDCSGKIGFVERSAPFRLSQIQRVKDVDESIHTKSIPVGLQVKAVLQTLWSLF
ncbi:hypothetical protein GW915_03800 [bacterium]|nr:hypothetical protein [bacterium]